MNRWIKKDGKYQHLVRDDNNNLYVDGRLVCKTADIFIIYLFEKYAVDNSK